MIRYNFRKIVGSPYVPSVNQKTKLRTAAVNSDGSLFFYRECNSVTPTRSCMSSVK